MFLFAKTTVSSSFHPSLLLGVDTKKKTILTPAPSDPLGGGRKKK
jgi:hypothetical protein